MEVTTATTEKQRYVPLVSVGLPTFNRASVLVKAVESVLAQDWPKLELVICDNGSSDGTEAICARFVRADPRVRYFRQTENLGPTANFVTALENSRGEYFMWLGDDDWLPDPSYLKRCTSYLLANLDFSLACGTTRYFRGATFSAEGSKIDLLQSSPADRVAGYFATVDDNGIFYGVMRRDQLRRIKITRVIASDWLLLAAIAFQGKVKTLEETSIHREDKTAERSFQKLAADNAASPVRARYPFLFIGLSILHAIAWACPVYGGLPLPKRLALGFRCQAIVLHRFSWPRMREKLRRITRCLLPS